MTRSRPPTQWRGALPLATGAGAVGIGAGILIAGATGAETGEFDLQLPLLLGVGAAVVGFAAGTLAGGRGGASFDRLYGAVRRRTRHYPEIEAMVERGEVEAAVEAYRTAASRDPDDPEPLIQGARLLRDHFEDHEAAEAWLRRARGLLGLTMADRAVVARMLVGLYDGPLDEPEQALAELARIVDRYPGTHVGNWACRRMVDLQLRLRPDPDDAG